MYPASYIYPRYIQDTLPTLNSQIYSLKLLLITPIPTFYIILFYLKIFTDRQFYSNNIPPPEQTNK